MKRFMLRSDLTLLQQEAICGAYSDAWCDARNALRAQCIPLARFHAKSTRRLIAAFCIEIPKSTRRMLGWL